MKWSELNSRDFPWRHGRQTPYRALVFELMLKRTRAENVAPVYERFIERFPNIDAIEIADIESIEEVLRPIGLHRSRAREFKKTARIIVEDHHGRVPSDLTSLLKLPGIGRYTAHAILCFGCGQAAQIVDVNVRRILGRYFGIDPRARKDAVYWDMAWRLLPVDWATDFNRALLDLGALVCTARKPGCGRCPLSANCTAQKWKQTGANGA